MVDEGPTGIKAPDGGWGWAVLWGCFVITGFSYAFPKAVSVFFKELMREFGIGYSDTAWVSSILLAMLYGTGEGPSCPRDASESSPGSVLGRGPGIGGHLVFAAQPPGLPRGKPYQGSVVAQAAWGPGQRAVSAQLGWVPAPVPTDAWVLPPAQLHRRRGLSWEALLVSPALPGRRAGDLCPLSRRWGTGRAGLGLAPPPQLSPTRQARSAVCV